LTALKWHSNWSMLQLLGAGLAVLDGIDPNPDNFVCAGIVHTTSFQIGCLVRLEPNKPATVRVLLSAVLHLPSSFVFSNGVMGGSVASRVVSVLDSVAEAPRFKSQPRRCQVNCSHPLCLCSPSSKIGSSPLKGCGGNCRTGGK